MSSRWPIASDPRRRTPSRAAPGNKATRPHKQDPNHKTEVHKMAWLYIPAETGERIETICNQHYNPGRGACDCPLWPACSYSNDLTKSNAENTRILSRAWPPLWPPSTTKTGGKQHGIHRTQDQRHLCPRPRRLRPADQRADNAFVPDFSAARYDPKPASCSATPRTTPH